MADRFPQEFLDEIKSRLPVSDVVRKRIALKKEGNLWVGLSPFNKEKTPSFKVNNEKQFFHCFSSGRHGSIFDFVVLTEGIAFVDAVKKLADMAGLPLPGGRKPTASAGNGNGKHAEAEPANYTRTQNSRREITEVYQYHDAESALLYEVCRQEWFENGKREKTFFQRRPGPDGKHAWALSRGLYLKASNGEWYTATEDRLTKWKGAERAELDEVPHTLYRFDELLSEVKPDPEDPDYRRTIFIAEGEKDCETLRAWGMFATTNSGGAKHWRQEFAEYFRDQNVVVLLDNDLSGRQRGHAVAASLRPIARRVQVVSWPDHWPGCPDKADVTDWRDQIGGTADKLFRIIDTLPEWTPQPPDSRLGALRFVELGKPRRKLEWLVKGIMQRGEMSLWFGDFSTGKSFVLTDLCFSIARNGTTWMGLRTRPGLVLYQIGEGAIGYGNRMEAYRIHHRIPPDEDIPFVALRSRVNLFANDDDMKKIIDEAKGWNTYYDIPLELICVDTFSAATSGADENAGRDVGPVLERGRRISTETGVHVAIVHHVPKGGGTPRGWSGFLGNVDSAVMVETLDQFHDHEYQDGNKRRLPVHQFKLVKQKDGEIGLARQFVLPQVKLGVDTDGDPITSCIVLEVGDRIEHSKVSGPARRPCPEGYCELLPANEDIFRCLVAALRKHGHRPIPEGCDAPNGALIITIKEWQQELIDLSVGHEEITITLRERIKRRIQRAQKGWLPAPIGIGLIYKSGEYVWRTDRKVHPVDPPPARKVEQPEPMLAPGETQNDLSF